MDMEEMFSCINISDAQFTWEIRQALVGRYIVTIPLFFGWDLCKFFTSKKNLISIVTDKMEILIAKIAITYFTCNWFISVPILKLSTDNRSKHRKTNVVMMPKCLFGMKNSFFSNLEKCKFEHSFNKNNKSIQHVAISIL